MIMAVRRVRFNRTDRLRSLSRSGYAWGSQFSVSNNSIHAFDGLECTRSSGGRSTLECSVSGSSRGVRRIPRCSTGTRCNA
jgi:hypothetical protein